MDFIVLLQILAKLGDELSKHLSQSQNLVGTEQPNSNAYNSLVQHILSVSASAMPRAGVIVDYVPFVRAYRVQPEGGGPLILCSRTTQGTSQPLGVADCDTFAPGTPVYFMQHQSTGWGMITGTMPLFSHDRRLVRTDYISQGSRCGLSVDAAYQLPFSMGGPGSGGGVKSWGVRMPLDDIGCGSFTRLTETGLVLHMDPEMLEMRVNELTGLFMTYLDNYLRLSGENFEHWTSGVEHVSFDDQGEHHWFYGAAGYICEQFGQYMRPQAWTQQHNAQEVQLQRPELGYEEPIPQQVQAFHRTQVWQGYTGQGYNLFQVIPPQENSQLQMYPGNDTYNGVAQLVQTFAGGAGWRSALGFSITKRPLQPQPKRKWQPQDPMGDKEDNYKAAGMFGAGADHKLKAWPDKPAQHPLLANAASVVDLHAHLFNWKACHPAHYHEKDFHFPEESSMPIGSNQIVPTFSKLKTEDYLKPPDPVQLEVDHRHSARYTPNTAGIDFTDDGSVIIYDGFGSEIVMTGGKIFARAAGDIMFESGRDMNLWAGHDLNARARDSVDITTTERDIRLKAEHNIQMISANDGGPHGIMLECRSEVKTYNFDEPGERTEHSGIIFKSETAPVVAWSSDVYLRTLSGNIVLDANKQLGNVIVHAAEIERFILTRAADHFGPEDDFQYTNVWGAGVATLDTTIHTTGSLVTDGSHTLRGNIFVVSGHIYCESGNEKVGHLQGIALQQANGAVDQANKAAKTNEQIGKTHYRSRMTEAWYAIGKAGNDEIIEDAECSLRVLRDYQSDDFVLFESRWAQMGRLDGKIPNYWTERPVTFKNQETYPYPGKEKFTAESASEGDGVYFTIDPNLYDVPSGRSKPRGAIYEDAKLGTPRPIKLNGNYPIIRDTNGNGTTSQSSGGSSPGETPSSGNSPGQSPGETGG